MRKLNRGQYDFQIVKSNALTLKGILKIKKEGSCKR